MSLKTHANVQDFIHKYAAHPHYKAPRGSELHCANWEIEAPLRMLLNNLDAEVAENPEQLIVYGGRGKAARNQEALQAIIAGLLRLKEDQSLLIQSGKPVAILPTHPNSPRVLIANSNLVPNWSTWEEFDRLEQLGLMMYGQMTAGSWIYIGSQGILQGTYETFAALAEQHFNGSLEGRLVVTGGLGGMGGAQPLAVTLNGGVALIAEVDPDHIQKRLDTRYLDKMTSSLDEALQWAEQAQRDKQPLSIGYLGNVVDLHEALLERRIVPDVITDQTSAHDPVNGYLPSGLSLDAGASLRQSDPKGYRQRSLDSMVRHVRAMLTQQERGSIVFDYGNNLRGFAKEGGAQDAFGFPGFVPAYIRPLFCEGRGPFRWCALSGDPEDIRTTDRALAEAFPNDPKLQRWLDYAGKQVAFQGLPARICWLGMGEREKAGLLFNELVRTGAVSAPIVIGRDHLDTGSVASPYRETESMKDSSDAVSDWPLLNLMVNTAAGATWVSFHHGGGVGMGFSQHAGMVIVADGSEDAKQRLSRVLHNDPAMGVIRHADAGYSEAENCRIQHHLTGYNELLEDAT